MQTQRPNHAGCIQLVILIVCILAVLTTSGPPQFVAAIAFIAAGALTLWQLR